MSKTKNPKNSKKATPCKALWEEMVGNQCIRFCHTCKLNVYQLKSLEKEEALDLMETVEGHASEPFYTRSDGTLLTQDCPLKSISSTKKRPFGSVAIFSLLLALLAIWGAFRSEVHREIIMIISFHLKSTPGIRHPTLNPQEVHLLEGEPYRQIETKAEWLFYLPNQKVEGNVHFTLKGIDGKIYPVFKGETYYSKKKYIGSSCLTDNPAPPERYKARRIKILRKKYWKENTSNSKEEIEVIGGEPYLVLTESGQRSRTPTFRKKEIHFFEGKPYRLIESIDDTKYYLQNKWVQGEFSSIIHAKDGNRYYIISGESYYSEYGSSLQHHRTGR
jgi:hypothetical protein